MQKFTQRQLEAMRIVYSDLDFIEKNWGDVIDDDSLRRNSTIIRQLLTDNGGLLQVVAKWVNLKVRVQAPLNPLLTTDLSVINFYFAGGGTHKGMSMRSILSKNYVMTKEEVKSDYENSKGVQNIAVDVSDFLNMPSIITNGEVFNRIEVIKYVAHKLGGAHYELDEKKLNRKKHLEKMKNSLSLADKNSIYFEFLSIGQILIKSKYTSKLRKKIMSVLIIKK